MIQKFISGLWDGLRLQHGRHIHIFLLGLATGNVDIQAFPFLFHFIAQFNLFIFGLLFVAAMSTYKYKRDSRVIFNFSPWIIKFFFQPFRGNPDYDKVTKPNLTEFYFWILIQRWLIFPMIPTVFQTWQMIVRKSMSKASSSVGEDFKLR